MAGYEGMTRIDPESPVYQEFARLYRIAQEMHPGGLDRWNGELYSRTDDKYGGLTRDGTFRLNQTLVLDQLTGGEGTGDPVRQGQALATVLHESLHARVEMDAKLEPNALRRPQSIGLDEGLTELATMEDYEQFAQLAGYEDTQTPDPEYPGAVHAAGELLDRASTSGAERADLLSAAIDQPVMMRWDTIAGSIVQNELADTVPPDADHQQAARAHLVNQMAVDEWAVVHDLDGLGPATAELTNEAVDNGVAQLREHYQNTPDEPYPARTPNPAAEVATQTTQPTEQQRATTTPARDHPVDLTKLPPPDATTRVADPSPSNPHPATPGLPSRRPATPALPSPHPATPALPSRHPPAPSNPPPATPRAHNPATHSPPPPPAPTAHSPQLTLPVSRATPCASSTTRPPPPTPPAQALP
ncbi:hypothetical protein F1D05_06215 [Kribbella qitaiheensis]|uniref:Uncharacterized protein n=1 Tax=Kribbella qitaiheensis TaxID=1544730 RepID=A0A7G6WUB0_9ACTN|nr:hypothetical protein [Kribbella qitaiheensis]QNE17575.1 hypothetical protein F1D05_06215 [Kribbella qitaiheensis]